MRAWTVIGAEIDLGIVSGRNLVAKDGSGFLKLGSKTTSDPYVIATFGSFKFETNVVRKNLNPEWNASCKWMIEGRNFKPSAELVLTIFDRDRGSADDPMGEVRMTLREVCQGGPTTEKWYPVKPCKGCKEVSGDLNLKISCNLRKALSLTQKEAMAVPPTANAIAVGLGWDPLPGNKAIDLDTSCVCVSFSGQVLQDECCYFAQLVTRSCAAAGEQSSPTTPLAHSSLPAVASLHIVTRVHVRCVQSRPTSACVWTRCLHAWRQRCDHP